MVTFRVKNKIFNRKGGVKCPTSLDYSENQTTLEQDDGSGYDFKLFKEQDAI